MPIRKLISRGILALTMTVAPLTGATIGIFERGPRQGRKWQRQFWWWWKRQWEWEWRQPWQRGLEPWQVWHCAFPFEDEFKVGCKYADARIAFFHEKKTGKATKPDKPVKSGNAAKKSLKNTKSETVGLSSLNRNYHAYMHSNDPRLAPVAAYVMAYAEFEKVSGPDVVPTDPALSDEALREALTGFTKGGVVSDDALAEAKEILGVGPAVGKIDEIRETLPDPEAVDTVEEPTTTETTTTVTIVTETPTEPAN